MRRAAPVRHPFHDSLENLVPCAEFATSGLGVLAATGTGLGVLAATGAETLKVANPINSPRSPRCSSSENSLLSTPLEREKIRLLRRRAAEACGVGQNTYGIPPGYWGPGEAPFMC